MFLLLKGCNKKQENSKQVSCPKFYAYTKSNFSVHIRKEVGTKLTVRINHVNYLILLFSLAKVFDPNEKTMSQTAIDLIALQIFNDLKNRSFRIPDNDRLQIKTLLSTTELDYAQ